MVGDRRDFLERHPYLPDRIVGVAGAVLVIGAVAFSMFYGFGKDVEPVGKENFSIEDSVENNRGKRGYYGTRALTYGLLEEEG